MVSKSPGPIKSLTEDGGLTGAVSSPGACPAGNIDLLNCWPNEAGASSNTTTTGRTSRDATTFPALYIARFIGAILPQIFESYSLVVILVIIPGVRIHAVHYESRDLCVGPEQHISSPHQGLLGGLFCSRDQQYRIGFRRKDDRIRDHQRR